MIHTLKAKMYFLVAGYFRFWARIQLHKWNPKIITVTGSSGKTTTLHLIKAQFGDKAKYSDKANSAFGIPFDILGLKRKTLFSTEWLSLLVKAPFAAFKKPFLDKVYITEVDCDRPNEGRFLAKLLKPDITIWLSSAETHVMNFDKLISSGEFRTPAEAIAYEFGHLAAATKSHLIINADNDLICQQINRSTASLVKQISINDCAAYSVNNKGTTYKSYETTFHIPYLLPKLSFYSIEATKYLCSIMSLPFDPSFIKLELPPSRSSILKGIKGITIIDSSYNSAVDPLTTMLELFEIFPSDNKWVVIGDMLEQGSNEKSAHERIAKLLLNRQYKKIILMGPRIAKYTAPILSQSMKKDELIVFQNPKEVLDFIVNNLNGGEAVFFKGARFLEGVIEHLLVDRNDVNKLCRQEAIWQKRRRNWGL